MNWFKDNLLMLLTFASLGLLIALLVSIAMYQNQRADFTDVKGKYSSLQTTNTANAKKVVDLVEERNELIRKRSLDIQAAIDAAEALEAYKATTAKTYDDNRRMRDALKRKSPEARGYLEQGMPRELACTLWPERCR